ncbi:MAG: hypothetical protein ACRDXX_07220 [Stackebrandtia sp.]
MKPRRWIPVLLLAAMIVLGNGYSGVVIWTFTSGESTTAVVDDCRRGGEDADCFGTWVDASGESQDGEIVGTAGGDVGEEIPIRIGPFGAYADKAHVMWLRMWPGGVVDVGILGALILLPLFLAGGARAAKRLRAEAAPGSRIWKMSRSSIDDDGGPIVSIVRHTRTSAELTSPQGLPLFKLEGVDDKPRVVGVRRADGAPVGSVRRELDAPGSAPPPKFTLFGPMGAVVGQATMKLGLRSRVEFLTPEGVPLGTMVFAAPVAIRVEPHTDRQAEALLQAFAASHEWLMEHNVSIPDRTTT